MRSFDGVIFDLDGLLLDSEPVYRRAWQRACADCGFSLSLEQHRSLTGRGRKGAIKALRDLTTVRFDADQIAKRLDECEIEEFAKASPALKPGAMELLGALKAAEKRRALATSTLRERAIGRLERVRLLSEFDAVICGDDVNAGKPAPDIFLKAAAAIGCEPARCVVCEDAASGIRAAHAAGMMPLLVPDGYELPADVQALAAKVFPSLHDVRAFLL